MTPVEQVRAKCNEMVAKCKDLYGMDLSQVRISFDLRGRSAGRAGGRGFRLGGSAYYVKFNRDMLTREAFDHVLNDTVPHEYAHVVCFMDPSKGKNHDYGWASVCRRLGGSGGRTHSEEVVFGKGRTFEYKSDRGHMVRLSEKHHAAVQAGRTITFLKGKGKVTKLCEFSIVGFRGRTLEQPVQAKPVNHPSNVEAALRSSMHQTPAPAFAAPVAPVQPKFDSGASKATVAQAIMLAGFQRNKPREEIIQAIMLANGHAKALATSYFKHYSAKVGIPANYL